MRKAFHLLSRVGQFTVLTIALFAFQNCDSGFKAISESGYTDLSSVGPKILISSSPPSVTNQKSASVVFSVTSADLTTIKEIRCNLDSQTPVTCVSPFNLQNLADGDHSINISATDNLNNVSQAAFVRWTVDATKPVVMISSAPAATSGATTATVSFNATDNLTGVAKIECSYENAAFNTCASPQIFNNLTEKSYSLKIRAIDKAGNISAESVTTWIVDSSAPTVVIATAPNPLVNTRTAAFTFSATDSGQPLTSFTCALDGGAFTTCTSPANFSNIADGQHSFSLKAIDLAGNASAAVSRTWVVDATAPTINLVSSPTNPTNSASATFQFTPADNAGGSGILRSECSLNGGSFAACTSPVTYTGLATGGRSFAVRAVDNATNVSAVANYSWSIDNVLPVVTISSNISNPTTETAATMTINASDAGTGIKALECKLDNAAYAACTSPVTFTGLAVGSHTFSARATDNVTNQNTAAFSWVISGTTPPASSFTYNKHILVDQFGYRPNDPKVAVIRNPNVGADAADKYAPGANYQVRRLSDDAVIFSGGITAWNNGAVQTNSGDNGWWFDFSSVTTPGTYYVADVDKKFRSPTFAIKQDVYKNILKAAVRMYYYNRSGIAKEEKYAGACWADGVSFMGPNQDSQAHDINDRNNAAKVRDLSGGWFDAGDTNKYLTFAREPVHRLLLAYQEDSVAFTDDFNIPESGNGIPDLIDEVKWEVNWLKKMQNPDGSAALKVGVLTYPVGLPSAIKDPTYYISSCTSSTIAAAGMFAHASLVYSKFSALSSEAVDLKTRAINAWNNYHSIGTKQTACDSQEIKSGDADWSVEQQNGAAAEAAIYLAAVTGEQKYHDYVKAHYREMRPYIDLAWSIYTANEGEALLFYTTVPGIDNALKAQILKDKTTNVSERTSVYGFSANADLYRNAFTEFYWGSNSYRSSFGTTNMDVVKYGLTSNSTPFTTRAAEVLHYMHGVNPFGMVYLSNMASYGATSSTKSIYHAWFTPGSKWSEVSATTCGPAPGYVPGGANMQYTGSVAGLAGQPHQKIWKDWNGGYPENSWEITEPGIYYQASYIKLLARHAH